MPKRISLIILIAGTFITAIWFIVERLLPSHTATIGTVDNSDLERQLRRCEQEIVQQRQIIRKHTLDGTPRSLDELFALFPSKYPQGDWRPADAVFEDCWFWSIDGLRLHGWYYRHEHPRAALLVLHGNAGNLTYRAPMAKQLHDRFAMSILIFDYRGYGRSEGIPTIEGILYDARAARHNLAEREGIAEKDIVLLGESLGGAVAVDLAAEDGARALILESTVSSLQDIASSHYSEVLAAVVPADKLNSISKIKKYTGPLLQSHGDRDHTIPISQAKKLFDAANEPKTFVILPGKDHNDSKPNSYYPAMQLFLDKYIGR